MLDGPGRVPNPPRGKYEPQLGQNSMSIDRMKINTNKLHGSDNSTGNSMNTSWTPKEKETPKEREILVNNP